MSHVNLYMDKGRMNLMPMQIYATFTHYNV